VYTGGGSIGSLPGTVAAAGTVAQPTYSASVELAAGPAAVAGSGVVTQPVYSGISGLSSAGSVVSASGKITQPVYAGGGLLVATAATAQASSSFDPPVWTAAGGLETSSAAVSAEASFTPKFLAAAGLLSETATVEALGQSVKPVYDAAASLVGSAAVLSVAGAYSQIPNNGEFWEFQDELVSRYYPTTEPGRAYPGDRDSQTRLYGVVSPDRGFVVVFPARVYWNTEGIDVGANPERGLIRYTTKKEVKTFGIDFSNEGAVRDGAVLSSPAVTVVKLSSVSGNPTAPVVAAGPAVLTADFSDSDGKKIKAQKGVKVQIDATGADKGKYALSCVVRATPPGGVAYDLLEGGGVLVVD
jgi:hypothetical protein